MARLSRRHQLTEKTERDLAAIIDRTVQERGALEANTCLDGPESRAELLVEDPDTGSARQALSEGLPSFPYESHILYCRKRAGDIVIARVLHRHMDPVRHLRSFASVNF